MSESVLSKILDNLTETKYQEKITSKDRVLQFYGANTQFLFRFLKYVNDWRYNQFKLSRKLLDCNLEESQNGNYPLNLPAYGDMPKFPNGFESELISSQQFEQLNPRLGSLKFRVGNTTEVELLPGEQKDAKEIIGQSERKTVFINANGTINTLGWLNEDYKYKGPDSYMAVGLVNKTTLLDEDLSLFKFHFEPEYTSFLKIYKVTKNPQGKAVSLAQAWSFNGYGPIVKLQALPVLGGGGSSIVAILFSDGIVRFYPIHYGEEVKYLLAKTSLLEVKLKGEHKITCFDFFDSKTLLVGSNTGYVAEFDLNDVTVPNLFVRKHAGFIKKVLAVPEIKSYAKQFIVSFGFDGYIISTEKSDLHNTNICRSRRSGSLNIVVGYCRPLHGIITTYNNHVKLVGLRALKNLSANLSRHLSHTVICSVATSRYHPFILSAGANGELITHNGVDPLVLPSRKPAEIYKQMKLWRVEYNSDLGVYKINGELSLRDPVGRTAKKKARVSTASTVTKAKSTLTNIDDLIDDPEYTSKSPLTFPSEIQINNLEWCENVEGFAYYGFTLVNDLVVVDELESV